MKTIMFLPNGKGVEHSINTHLELQHNKNNDDDDNDKPLA